MQIQIQICIFVCAERNGGFGRLDAAVGVGMEIVSSIGLLLSLDSSSTNPAQPFLGRVIHFLLGGQFFPGVFSFRGKGIWRRGRAILIISEVKKLMGTKRRRDVQVEAQPVGWEQSCMQSHTVCCTISQSHKHTVCCTAHKHTTKNHKKWTHRVINRG